MPNTLPRLSPHSSTTLPILLATASSARRTAPSPQTPPNTMAALPTFEPSGQTKPDKALPPSSLPPQALATVAAPSAKTHRTKQATEGELIALARLQPTPSATTTPIRRRSRQDLRRLIASRAKPLHEDQVLLAGYRLAVLKANLKQRQANRGTQCRKRGA